MAAAERDFKLMHGVEFEVNHSAIEHEEPEENK